jgi:DNA-binding MarR family transcriptional regulator
MNDEVLKLENQLCFPLYVAAKEVVNQYKPFLDAIDLTYTQYITMMVLWDKQKINVKDLGLCLHLDSGTLTPLLKKLESKGYVRRERSEQDERVVNINITREGERLKTRAVEIPGQIVNCLSLSQVEAETLYMLLYKVIHSVECKDNNK